MKLSLFLDAVRIRRKPTDQQGATQLMCSLSKLVPNDFMVLISSFESSSTQHDVNLVNYGPIYFKIGYKSGYALGRCYPGIDRLLPW